MNFLHALIAILILTVAAAGIAMSPLSPVVLIVLPYATFATFIGGVVYRVTAWARIPVPFSIATTCGQQKSLSWLKGETLESPSTPAGVFVRMALEVLCFRSLFRNTDLKLVNGRPVYGSAKWLWLFGMLFHWSLLIIVVRHLRFFIEPVTSWVNGLSAIDGFFQIGVPVLYLSDVAILAGLTFLVLRRLFVVQVRYISLFADHFSLLLLLSIAVTGVLMRMVFPADLEQVKSLAMGWVTFAPHVPKDASILFQTHLAFVCVLLVWFPFSKLMHMGGVFLSPTRNLANDCRMRRHINPWNAPVKVHTYEEYEDDFREQMKTAGLPVEKE
jgi:nitrate reductase gamma subunit